MAPFTDTIHDGRLVWTAAATAAFEAIKENLCSAPILALPDFTLVFELHCDASKTGISAVLSQKADRLLSLVKNLLVHVPVTARMMSSSMLSYRL